MEKILKFIFVTIIIIIVIGIAIALLPILIIGLLLGIIFGKVQMKKLNALRNRSYGQPENEDSISSDNEPIIDYQDGDIIDIKAEEIKEKE